MDSFVAERDRALIEMDIGWARALAGPGVDDDTLLTSMHMARYECRHIPDALRHASRQWLENHGHSRLRGFPWPINGELEK